MLKNWSSQYFVKLFVAQLRENMRNSGCLFDMRLILCRWLKNDQHSREMLPACSQEYLQREFVTNNTPLHHNMLGQGRVKLV